MIPLNIFLQKGLVGNNLTQWHILVGWVAHDRLSNAPDRFLWGLLQNGVFTVNSIYNALIMDTT
jgi:hypothetical protein